MKFILESRRGVRSRGMEWKCLASVLTHREIRGSFSCSVALLGSFLPYVSHTLH